MSKIKKLVELFSGKKEKCLDVNFVLRKKCSEIFAIKKIKFVLDSKSKTCRVNPKKEI
jgi:hypothetical protein